MAEKIYRKRVFNELSDRSNSLVVSDLRLEKCRFVNCFMTNKPSKRDRPLLRRVSLIDCSFRQCFVNNAIFDEIFVDNLKASGWAKLNACAFRHVVIRGLCTGRFQIRWWANPGLEEKGRVQARQVMDQANQKFYAGVDWALDISEAQFTDTRIEGVPLHLVRRDPETQFAFTLERVRKSDFQSRTDLEGMRSELEVILHNEIECSIHTVPPPGHKYHEKRKRALLRLRDHGIAEPD